MHCGYIFNLICLQGCRCSITVMAKRSALQVFEHYYQGLMYSLPFNDTDFMEDLSKHDLLPQNIKVKLDELSKIKEKASYFLDFLIKPGLLVGDNTYFITLLAVMKNSQYNSVNDLAKLIESESKCLICQFSVYKLYNQLFCMYINACV